MRAVDSLQLHPDQLDRVLATVCKQRDYLWRLVERMRVRRFSNDDPVYLAALGAYEKASNLCVVVATTREKLRNGPAQGTIMERKPWGG